MKNIFKNHYGSVLLLLFFIKILAFSLTYPEAIIFGCLSIFSGFQLYLYHLRLHTYHQKQINLIKKDIHQLKSISAQVKSVNNIMHQTSKLQESAPKSSWSGM